MPLSREELKAKKDSAITALFSSNRASKNASYALLDLIDYIDSAGLDASDLRAAFSSIPVVQNNDIANLTPNASAVPPPAANPPTPSSKAKATPSKASATKATPSKAKSAASGALTTPQSITNPRYSSQQGVNGGSEAIKPSARKSSSRKTEPQTDVSISRTPMLSQKAAEEESPVDEAPEEIEESQKPVKRTRKRAPKDPNAPKRPLSAFLKFRNEIAAENKANGQPSLSWDALNTTVKERWNSLSENERNARKEDFLHQVEEFHKNMEEYNSNNAHNEQGSEDTPVSSQVESSQPTNSQLPSSQPESNVPSVVIPASSQAEGVVPPKKKHKKDKSKSKEKEKDKQKEKA